jgi:hypothetical protein
MPRWLVLLLIALGAGSWWLAHRNSAPLAATIGGNGANDACRVLQVPARIEDALQSAQTAIPFRAGNAQLTPLAGFSVDGRVLSREDYQYGRESQFSPTDLALGWGPMSAPGLADKLEISQGGRWYRYHWGGEGPPLAPADIATHSANMHMVPASDEVARALSQVRADEKIRLDGWLLRIDGDEGWHWQSSMSRDDAGAGACELVLVCRIGPG